MTIAIEIVLRAIYRILPRILWWRRPSLPVCVRAGPAGLSEPLSATRTLAHSSLTVHSQYKCSPHFVNGLKIS